MKRRRWLKRLLILVGIFVVLLVLFTLLVFNPFEPDMDDLDGMVPMRFEGRELSFVVRAPSLAELKKRAFFASRLYESELWNGLVRDHQLDQYLFDQVSELEIQIKRVVAGLIDFEFMEDAVGEEVLFAGALDVDDLPASPYLFLTRVSWRVKLLFGVGLRYEKIRKQIEAQANLRIKEERFWYEVTVLDPERKRSQKEDLTFYLARTRDVLAIASEPALLKEAIFLSQAQGAESLRYKHGGYMKSLAYGTAGREVAAWFDVLQLNDAHGLADKLEPAPGEPRGVEDLLTELVPPRIQYDASVSLDLSDSSILRASILLGEVKADEIPKHIETFYRGEWIGVRPAMEEVGAFAPADRTVALASLSVSPQSFLRVFFAYLKQSTQELVMDELRKVGEAPEDVIDDLGQYLSRPVGMVVTRINEAVDELPLNSLDEGWKVAPRAAYHLTMKFHGLDRIDVFTEALVDRVRRLGYMKASRRPETPEGLPDVRYWPMPIEDEYRDSNDPLLVPAMAVLGDRFFFSTNGEELLRCLRAAAAGPDGTLAGEADLPAFLDQAPDQAGLIVLLRGESFRAYLRDQRYEKAIADAEAVVTNQSRLLRVRSDIARELTAGGMKQDAEYRRVREERVQEWVDDTKKKLFREGLDRWDGVVRKFGPVRTILLTLAPLPEESEGVLLVDCGE